MLVTQLISLKGNYLFPNRTIRSKQYLCKSLIGLLDGVRLCLALSRFAHNRGIRFMRADGILTSSPSPPWTLNLQARRTRQCGGVLRLSAAPGGGAAPAVAFVPSVRRPTNAQTGFLSWCHSGGWSARLRPFGVLAGSEAWTGEYEYRCASLAAKAHRRVAALSSSLAIYVGCLLVLTRLGAAALLSRCPAGDRFCQ
jgi:hypothetical protein